jgi:hypothetical protein
MRRKPNARIDNKRNIRHSLAEFTHRGRIARALARPDRSSPAESLRRSGERNEPGGVYGTASQGNRLRFSTLPALAQLLGRSALIGSTLPMMSVRRGESTTPFALQTTTQFQLHCQFLGRPTTNGSGPRSSSNRPRIRTGDNPMFLKASQD